MSVVAFAYLGAIIAQISDLSIARRKEQKYDFRFGLLVFIAAASWTILYFKFFQVPWPGIKGQVCVTHYSIFISFFLEAVSSVFTVGPPDTAQQGIAAGVAGGAGSNLLGMLGKASSPNAGSAVILNGFWPVFGVGTFGAFLAELLVHYRNRSKKAARRSRRYWVVTALMILSGGVVTAVYGTSNISAPLAMQLGASAPLIIGRLMK